MDARIRWLVAAALFAAAGPLGAQSSLSVETQGGWAEWWRADRAPRQWPSTDPIVERAISWTGLTAGVERGELRVAARRGLWKFRVVLARFDAARVRVTLVTAAGGAQAWTIDDAPANATIALNAGQFTDAGVWGWLIRDGIEQQPPGYGPLSTAVTVDSSGAFRLVDFADIDTVRARGRIVTAFQSYPTILSGNGEVPAALLASGRGVDLNHRDARLALCELRSGRTLVALTRFDTLDGALGSAPFGPTVPEMSALMGALGCVRAVMLDGGISAQLLLRTAAGRTQMWNGWRKVRLGLVVHAVAR